MCFGKRIKHLQNSVNELTDIVKTQELVRLRNESDELKKIKEMLSKIRLEVKEVKVVEDNGNGYDTLKIRYNIPDLLLYFDENNELYPNETFLSINMLNLISFEDMKKIKKILNEKKMLDNNKNA